MSQADITRLVVGEPFTLGMGRPVGQSIKTADVSMSLRWRDGKWQGKPPLLERLKPRKKPSMLLVLPAFTKKRIALKPVLLGAAFIALAGVGGILGLLLQSRDIAFLADSPALPEGALPLVRAAENIRTVDQPFPQGSAEAYQVIQTTDQPLPDGEVLALPIVASAGSSVAPAAAAARRPVDVPPPMPMPNTPLAELPASRVPPRQDARVSAKTAKDEPRPPAVILDEMAERTGKPVAATQQLPDTKSSREPVKQAAAAPATQPAVSAATAARGLIAITPDGKSAVFTDQTTRLPKQFKAGDKLPNGDVIKSIDLAQGKVIAGTKEYSLD